MDDSKLRNDQISHLLTTTHTHTQTQGKHQHKSFAHTLDSLAGYVCGLARCIIDLCIDSFQTIYPSVIYVLVISNLFRIASERRLQMPVRAIRMQ